MRKRQDAWTNDEDVILAETVLRFVRNGKTQIDAFAEAGKALKRTAAACGFRWNKVVRKQYEEAFQLAKQQAKKQNHEVEKKEKTSEPHPIDAAISLLEAMKTNQLSEHHMDYDARLQQLTTENENLKNQLQRYQEVILEMKNLWEWLDKELHENHRQI